MPWSLMGVASTVIAILSAIAVPAKSGDDVSRIMEFQSGKTSYQGRLAAQTPDELWLMARDGRLNRFNADGIHARRSLTSEFRSFTAGELRDRLRRELGKDFDVVGTEHYLVAAASGTADRYAPLFEEVYRSFRGHFSIRGFEMKKPEFPLVAIVHPDRKSFIERCADDGVRYVPGLMGYYHPISNRVVVFVSGENEVSGRDQDRHRMLGSADSREFPVWGATGGDSGPNEALGSLTDMKTGLRDTIVHETAHQVAFNSGLHARLGDTPRWVIEGLATVFEGGTTKSGDSARKSAPQRINRERYLRFGNFAQSRRRAGSLKAFLSDDDMLSSATLDFYAESWALTFFLTETRSADYHRYLKRITDRPTLKPYSTANRLRDFEKAFGSDLDQLEAEYLRYLRRIERR